MMIMTILTITLIKTCILMVAYMMMADPASLASDHVRVPNFSTARIQ